MKPFIYALVDPIERGHIRYVGMAVNNPNRPYEHAKNLRERDDTHKGNWVRKVLSEGREPIVLILEELPEDSPRSLIGFVEACYIKSLREIGHRLTNSTSGGDGCPDLSPESLAKMKERSVAGMLRNGAAAKLSAKAKIRWSDPAERAKQSAIIQATMTPERRAQIGADTKGRKHSDETRAQMSEAHKGLERTTEHCANLRASRTPEVRAAISAATLKRYEDPAARVKHSLAVKAAITDVTRAKLSAIHLGSKRSEETKARMREAWVKRRERNAGL
jgi:hypothetical protein